MTITESLLTRLKKLITEPVNSNTENETINLFNAIYGTSHDCLCMFNELFPQLKNLYYSTIMAESKKTNEKAADKKPAAKKGKAIYAFKKEFESKTICLNVNKKTVKIDKSNIEKYGHILAEHPIYKGTVEQVGAEHVEEEKEEEIDPNEQK